MIKAVFFDIDGTLVSFNTHKISDSSKEAIKILRDKGIKVFIASGRALYQIDNLDGLEFDGYITINGGSCFINDNGSYKEIYRVALDKNDLFSLIDYLNKDKFPCTVVTSDNVFINYTDDIIVHLYTMANVKIPRAIDFNDYVINNYDKILQLNIFVDENKEKYLMDNVLKNSKSSRWHFSFADVNSKYSGKEVGIDKIIEYYGIDLSETMAFGDGGNDMGMIEHAAIGVAMGNANESVKKIANYITDDVDNDGVYKALKHFNILD
ncbi:Cof-type HAD-IIB family hydrolase [Brachyspira hyodysenteriae]|uniref:Hydrolase n=1 Tax=Brachyspira hyodysenteriae ATCC 27164 TaxID=1266923 RepID=A0A3B6W2U6_BRAHO|nr:Cof-type HAD-IIB family hydrolase [Brachyspira hyodysenteriae]ANN62783.1 hydrolase [Brachyspira hyodysenteriae ATCC 27164]KLI13360.1 hydrolase [Brachyspira hyodysenteriae]KLI22697.1 hydrolase [Brachyspira hyodysenteriae]KLI25425.1 hydrolase [Brachyspira hyodysenteriae]KLI30108.1 hydrolase [Brachyspira hyodysenteriae]